MDKGEIADKEDEAWQNIDDLVMMMLYLQSWRESMGTGRKKEIEFVRAWKGYNFDILDKLYEKDFIRGSHKAKSVLLTEKGMRQAKKVLKRMSFKG